MGGSCVPPLDGLRWMAVRGSQGVVSEAAGGQRRPDGAQASWAGHRSCCGTGGDGDGGVPGDLSPGGPRSRSREQPPPPLPCRPGTSDRETAGPATTDLADRRRRGARAFRVRVLTVATAPGGGADGRGRGCLLRLSCSRVPGPVRAERGIRQGRG